MKTKFKAIFIPTLVSFLVVAAIILLYLFVYQHVPTVEMIYIIIFLLIGLWIGLFSVLNPKEKSLEDQIDQL